MTTPRDHADLWQPARSDDSTGGGGGEKPAEAAAPDAATPTPDAASEATTPTNPTTPTAPAVPAAEGTPPAAAAATPAGTSNRQTVAEAAQQLDDPALSPLVVTLLLLVLVGGSIFGAVFFMRGQTFPPEATMRDVFFTALKSDPIVTSFAEGVTFNVNGKKHNLLATNWDVEDTVDGKKGHLRLIHIVGDDDPEEVSAAFKSVANGGGWLYTPGDATQLAGFFESPADAHRVGKPEAIPDAARSAFFDALKAATFHTGVRPGGATAVIDKSQYALVVDGWSVVETDKDGPGHLRMRMIVGDTQPAKVVVRFVVENSQWKVITHDDRQLLARYCDALGKATPPAEPLPQVRLKTSKGNIDIELFEDDAPNSVANFIRLTEEGFYDGIRFHRIIQDFMIQTGCPNTRGGVNELTAGTGGPGYAIADEAQDRPFDAPLLLAMANSGPNTTGSQFFITTTEQPALQARGGYNLFGRVIAGKEVVEMIAATPCGIRQMGRGQEASLPLEDVFIEKATVLSKRTRSDYIVQKLPNPR